MKKLLCLLFSITAYSICIAQTTKEVKENFFQSSYIKPQKIITLSPGHYLIDFGKAAFGTLSLVAKSLQSDSLIFHVGEKLNQYNLVDRKPGGTIRYQKIITQAIPASEPYLLKFASEKRNTQPPAIILPDSFGTIMPFRYVEIENLKIPITDIAVTQKVFNYRFNDNASAFTSSDTVLNQIWDMCKHTIKATSFCGLYVDGDRERIPYEADALINQLSHYAVDNEYSLARKTNEYFINHPTWPTEWILHTVLLFYYDYLYTGNLSAIEKHYESLKNKMLIQLAREDGLISTKSPMLTDQLMKALGFENTEKKITDIVDWPLAERDGYEMANINTVVNSFYYSNLVRMAEIAGLLGKKEDSLSFYKKSIQVKNTINEKLFDAAKGIYVDGEGSLHSSLHANIFPLVFGIVSKENSKKVIEFIKSRGMACSVYGAQYLLEALYQNGEADYALRLINTTDGDRNWWNMIKLGSTMTLEAWDMKYKTNLDWNHAWGTAPANIITRYIWGIVPAQSGFEKVEIKPQLSNLTYSKIKVPTIKGTIHAEYKQISKKKKLFLIELPQNMSGDFILTDSNISKILVNNKKVKSKNGHLTLNPGVNRVKILFGMK